MTSFHLATSIDLQADDLSILTFLGDEDIAANILDCHADTTAVGTTASKPNGTIGIHSNAFVPVSDDDESISAGSLLSDFSFDTVNEEPSSAVASANDPPSFEIMVSKLNSMMMKSARSRAIVLKTVFPDLEKKTRKTTLVDFSSTRPSVVHKANRPSPKYTSSQERKHDKISTGSMRLGSRQDSCIGGFLRAWKKW